MVRPWAARWGATEAELRSQWPGDEFVRDAAQTATHAITIHAPAAANWPWILQIGQDRAGYYSYAWLENLFGAEMRNVFRIVPEFQARQVGDDVWMAPKRKYNGQARMVIARLEPKRSMVLIPPGNIEKMASGTEAEGTWAFILEPIGENTTRLIMRGRPDGLQRPVLAPILGMHLLGARALCDGAQDDAHDKAARGGGLRS